MYQLSVANHFRAGPLLSLSLSRSQNSNDTPAQNKQILRSSNKNKCRSRTTRPARQLLPETILLVRQVLGRVIYVYTYIYEGCFSSFRYHRGGKRWTKTQTKECVLSPVSPISYRMPPHITRKPQIPVNQSVFCVPAENH